EGGGPRARPLLPRQPPRRVSRGAAPARRRGARAARDRATARPGSLHREEPHPPRSARAARDARPGARGGRPLISCTRFDELHAQSTDAPLEGAERADFDAHLAGCPECVQRLRLYVATQQGLRDLGAWEEKQTVAPLPESLVQRILGS